jgi:hypothetical protein
VVSLFADDTTVYLSSEDSLERLLDILNLWCAASTAKFNESKTVLLPFGPASYRAKVVNERRMNNEMRHGTIGDNFRIIPDGHTCRILGAWIGNNVPHITPWPAVLEKISADLDRWNISMPTLEGKRHIINMVIGGRTQYLSRVQGMPQDIEETLKKAQHTFLWNGKRARVAHESMTLDIDAGGKQILPATYRASV